MFVILGAILLLLALLQPVGTLTIPSRTSRLSAATGAIFLSLGLLSYLFQLGLFLFSRDVYANWAQTTLTLVSIVGLLLLVSAAAISVRVRQNTPAIILLGLFVAYVFLRQTPAIRPFVDAIALAVLLIIAITLGTYSAGYITLTLRPRETFKDHVKGKLVANLPRVMYEDESATATVLFTNQRQLLPTVTILRHIVVPIPGTLSVTLQAAGFDVADGQTRSCTFTSVSKVPNDHYASFYWNVRPKSSGNFDLNLIAEITNGQKISAGHFPARIRVNKIFGLTAQQVWIMAGILGLLTGIASIGSFLLQLLRP
jgi:hypothetical protein